MNAQMVLRSAPVSGDLPHIFPAWMQKALEGAPDALQTHS
jgi:hypothetical protein